MKLFNARDAKIKALDGLNEKIEDELNAELEFVTKAIRSAVANNQLSTQINGVLHTKTREALRDEGYSVTTDDDLTGHWYTWISWG